MKIIFTTSYCLVWLFLISPILLYSQGSRIFLDGSFNDWQTISPLYNDPVGDAQGNPVDFQHLWSSNDENYLFFKIEIGVELNLQDLNQITLYLDTDNNSQTGTPIHGIGAELTWNFGQRMGTFTHNGNTITIHQNQVGIVSAPTVSDSVFEIAFSRSAQPDGQTPLFSGQNIRIVLQDQTSGGDLLPDNPGGVSFSFDETPLPPITSPAIAKQDTDTIRMLTYNVLFNGFFDPARLPNFTRILQAIQPEIIGFQEIYDHTAPETVTAIESILPSGGQQQWYGAKVNPDVIAVSRYPILNSYSIPGSVPGDNNGAFLIDLHPKFDAQLLFIVAHPPCCGNDEGRQYEMDAIMAFIRDAQNGGGVLTLDPQTPILIVGDMNLVGDAQQLRTLLTGEIVNTGTFGEPFTPDWDGSNLTDLLPRHLNLPMFYTWYSETSSFSPGRLDYMIFTDSVLDTRKSFALFTPALPPDTLAAYNLLSDDVLLASDHLPVVSDFAVQTPSSTNGEIIPTPRQYELHQNYPNPFNATTQISYRLFQSGRVKLDISNILGETIRVLVNQQQRPGFYRVTWDGKDGEGREVASGIYFYALQTSSAPSLLHSEMLVRTMMLVK